MRKTVLAGFLALLVVASAAAEQKEVFAPFVSRLKAAVRGPQIKLTWKDSPDISGECLVYRHTTEITQDNHKDASLAGTVEAGKEFFIDAPADKGEYYYAVLLRSPDGKVHDLFIPFRNKTMKPTALLEAGGEKDTAAIITGIRTKTEEGKIEISFKASRGDRDILLYRSTTPILTKDRLDRASIVASVKSETTSVWDYPVPGIPYYYAVVDAKLLEEGTALLVSGESASVAFAEIPLEPAKETFLLPKPEIKPERPQPLPYFLLGTELASGKDLQTQENAGLPASKLLSAETKKAVEAILARTPPREKPLRNPEILDIDKGRGATSEDFTLKTILDGPFARKDWKEAEKQLLTFLELRLSEETKTRSRFYLGQSYFFQDKLQEGFMEFLLASNRFYAETRPWLDAILDLRRLTSRRS